MYITTYIVAQDKFRIFSYNFIFTKTPRTPKADNTGIHQNKKRILSHITNSALGSDPVNFLIFSQDRIANSTYKNLSYFASQFHPILHPNMPENMIEIQYKCTLMFRILGYLYLVTNRQQLGYKRVYFLSIKKTGQSYYQRMFHHWTVSRDWRSKAQYKFSQHYFTISARTLSIIFQHSS